MLRYIIRRLLWMIPVLIFISIITFALAHAVPGGPFDREKALPPEIIATMTAIAPMMTVNIIKDGRFVKTRTKEFPYFEKIGRCPNPVCVTNHEPEARTKFWHIQNGVRCHYCETELGYHEII